MLVYYWLLDYSRDAKNSRDRISGYGDRISYPEIRIPVLYHEIRSNFCLPPHPNFLHFSGGVFPETRFAANLIFWAFTTDIEVADLIYLLSWIFYLIAEFGRIINEF